MHTYSTDNNLRPKVLAGIGALSYSIVIGIESLIPVIKTHLWGFVPIAPISWGVVFAVVYALFNQSGWKSPVLRKVGLVKTPDFSGEWVGYYATTSDRVPEEKVSDVFESEGDLTAVDATLEIDQTWQKISIRFNPETSSASNSRGATILTEEGYWPSLSYQYENQPDLESQDGMEMHHGTVDLELQHKGERRVLEGVYYTGPGRRNFGRMYFEQDGRP